MSDCAYPPTSNDMFWEQHGTKLIGSNKEQYELYPHEFWYVVPSRTEYPPKEGRRVRPLEFAFVLHNASLSKGLLVSPTILAHGIEPKPTKGGVAAQAETLLEQIRQESFAERPSRLRCYFLNADKATAEYRMRDILRGDKKLVRCYVVLDGGHFHLADSDIYERLEGRPDDANLARTYWETFKPKDSEETRRLEILAGSALYFPDWQTFPTIPFERLISWTIDNPPKEHNGG